MKLWQECVDKRIASLGIERYVISDIVRRYSEYDENKPDTLNDQFNA